MAHGHALHRHHRRQLVRPSPLTDYSFQGILQRNFRDMEIAFQHVATAILKYSKLDITLIRISSVTEDTFHVTLEARASNTGPAKASISPMTIELCGAGGCFGKLTLPELTTSPGGAPITVESQLVQITDKAALQAFIQPAINESNTILSLRNGSATLSVAALGVGPRSIRYERDIPLRGMGGPQVSIKAASLGSRPTAPYSAGNSGLKHAGKVVGVSVTLHVKNPGPLELSFGTCEFEVRNAEGGVFAELKGRLDIKCEYFDATFQGAADQGVALAEGTARLVGKKCVGAGWCDEAIRRIDVPVADTWKLLRALGIVYETPKRESAQVFRWRGKFWKKGTWI